jgi:hypothetical protein
MRYLLPAIALASLCAGCVQPPPPAPPPEMVSELAASVPGGANPNCREYQATGTVNGQQQPVIGRACRQPDGTWRLATEGDEEENLPEIADFKSWPSGDNPSCVDYSGTAISGAQRQPVVGRACTLFDGSTRITQGTPEQPAMTSVQYPPPPPDYPYGYPYPYYYADYYDPWFWGPPFVGVGGVFFFDHGRFHHGFGGRFAHGGHFGGRRGGGGHFGGGHH